MFCNQPFPENLEGVRKEDALLQLGFNVKHPGPEVDSPETRKERGEVINEIIQTERVYVQNLKILIEVYAFPLRNDETAKQFLPEDRFKAIFGEIEVILSYNSVFLENLEHSYDKNDPANSNFGQAFLKIVRVDGIIE